MRVALLPLARSTFDVPFADEKRRAMLALLDAGGHQLVGGAALLTEPEASAAALTALAGEAFDAVLVLQATFTDAGFILEVAQRLAAPLCLWAVREPRAGGRLRLNSFCGLNLAVHALGRAEASFSWAYLDPDEPQAAAELQALLSGKRLTNPLQGRPVDASPAAASPLEGARIVRIGAAPDGFVTCTYRADEVASRFGAEVTEVSLDTLFDAARGADANAVFELRAAVAQNLHDLDTVDQAELDRSLRLKLALDALQRTHAPQAFAIRCWPETFTEYGGAVCGPVAMMGEARLPCACEADVWGALTQTALQKVAKAPVFLVDLVDVDVADDSAVVWHCGQAPLSMAGSPARATIHTNRKMPLLYEFPLKPGRVTFMRLSQARGVPQMVIASGQMLERPSAFTGTSGVVRFDAPAATVLSRIMDCALEHHTALAYGDHAPALRALAARLDLPVLELTEPDRDGAQEAAA